MRDRNGSRQGAARMGRVVQTRLALDARNLALLAALALFAGCAASAPGPQKPVHLDDPGLHPVYGGGRYIKAVGVSAGGREEAELAARKGVSAQVISSLEAADSERLREVRRGDRGGESLAEYESIVSMKTRFERAELIRVDPASGFRDRQGWHALAYMDRQALAQAAQSDYAREAGRFGVLAAQAGDAYRQGSPCGFLDSWGQASEVFARMETNSRVLFVAGGGAYAPHRRNEETFLELFKLKGDFKHRMRFYVIMEGPGSELGKERVQAMFQRFFERQGLNVSFCATCPCTGPLTYRFLVKAREHRQWGVLGPVCRLSLAATVILCETEQPVLEVDLKLDHLRGAHARDEALALSNLYAQIDEEALYQTFRQAMTAHFCVEE